MHSIFLFNQIILLHNLFILLGFCYARSINLLISSLLPFLQSLSCLLVFISWHFRKWTSKPFWDCSPALHWSWWLLEMFFQWKAFWLLCCWQFTWNRYHIMVRSSRWYFLYSGLFPKLYILRCHILLLNIMFSCTFSFNHFLFQNLDTFLFQWDHHDHTQCVSIYLDILWSRYLLESIDKNYLKDPSMNSFLGIWLAIFLFLIFYQWFRIFRVRQLHSLWFLHRT